MKKLPLVLTLVLSLSVAVSIALAADGADLYKAKCASCHGADGGKTIMSKPVKGLTEADFSKKMLGYKAKTYGGAKKATMENLAGGLTEADIKALAKHVAKL